VVVEVVVLVVEVSFVVVVIEVDVVVFIVAIVVEAAETVVEVISPAPPPLPQPITAIDESNIIPIHITVNILFFILSHFYG